jgi:hypothetical protein
VAITAAVTNDVKEEAERLGICRVMEKPVNIDRLRAIIKDYLPLVRCIGYPPKNSSFI